MEVTPERLRRVPKVGPDGNACRRCSRGIWRAAVGFFLITSPLFGQPVVYVDDNATGANDGSTWEDAYTVLQDALDHAATSGGSVNEIWVASGTYRPSARTDPKDPRSATFQLRNGVAIRGGYLGCPDGDCDGGDPDERDVALYATILSGDLAGDDVEVASPEELLGQPTRAENSYHVVTGSGTDATAVLDSFSITAGYAHGMQPHDDGGGLHNESGSPTLTNCAFSGNSAADRGGGMYNWDCTPTLVNCTFSGNSAYWGGAISNLYRAQPSLTNCTFLGNAAVGGGGMSNWARSRPTLANCTFAGNTAGGGGGMSNWGSSPRLTNCTFLENVSSGGGGGMVNRYDARPILRDCTFSGNSADWNGGGILNYQSTPTLTGCTFLENVAEGSGGGMTSSSSNSVLRNCTFSGNSAGYGGGGMYNYRSSPMLTNCTFLGNSAGDEGGGGGMCNMRSGNPTLTNCVFSGNSTEWGGGAMSNYDSSPTLTDCTFSGNSAGEDGGGMYNSDESRPTLANCILWGNCDSYECGRTAQIFDDWESQTAVAYSCVQDVLARDGDVYAGVGNIDTAPLFVQSDGLDGVPGTADDDLSLLPRSPCIDAGDNTAVTADAADIDGDGDRNEPIPVDLRGHDRFFNDPCAFDMGNPDPSFPDLGIVDMGAFEYQGDAPGDPDGDGLAGCDDNCPLHFNPDQADCDDDGLGDYCALELEASQDCNGNSVPDICDLDDDTSDDCNANSVPDECDVADQTSRDCNENGTPDECDVLDGTSEDCNTNGVPDECDVAEQTSPDCNENQVPDQCDVSGGTSEDCNESGIPDECEPVHTGIIYVDAHAAGEDDGTSWANAANDLQDALYWACLGNEIWVASAGEHCYTPNRGTDDRDATFQLESGIALYGGFLGSDHPGGGETLRDERDRTANVTVLSGDLNGDDEPGFVNYSENSRHVVTGSGTDRTAVLDGFTITGGNGSGGGVLNVTGSPTISGCTFLENGPHGSGAGMKNAYGSDPTLVDCAFVRNKAGGWYGGGGMFNYASHPILANCVFKDNWALTGGGMVNSYASPVLVHCRFERNAARGQEGLQAGGGMLNSGASRPTLIGCTFTGNTAHNFGGAIYDEGETSSSLTNCLFTGNSAILGGVYYVHWASPTFTNCTFAHNTASLDGGGIYNVGRGVLTLANCILWGNADANGSDESAQIFNDGYAPGTVVVNYSTVQGWTGILGGVGNFGLDPRFVDAAGPDDILGSEDDDLRLADDSPCIDAGDNEAVPVEITTDFLGNPRFMDDPDTSDTGNGDAPIVDMGAYEFLEDGFVHLQLDMMPGRCPNRFNTRSNRPVSMAILGDEWFDVTMIDAESVVLSRADGVGGIVTPRGRGPKFGVYVQDVAAPLDGDECECHRRRADGLDDLVLVFSRQEIVEELELHTLRRGEHVTLVVSGNLANGTAFSASDCVMIAGRP